MDVRRVAVPTCRLFGDRAFSARAFFCPLSFVLGVPRGFFAPRNVGVQCCILRPIRQQFREKKFSDVPNDQPRGFAREQRFDPKIRARGLGSNGDGSLDRALFAKIY